MKKIHNIFFINLLLFLLLIWGCSSPFNFKRDTELTNEYKYTQRTNSLLLYYNIENHNGYKRIPMVVKNISGDFMSDLSLNYYSIDKSKYSYYVSLGDIKNRSVKYINLEVPSKLTQINISYEYYPVKEDSFLFYDTKDDSNAYYSIKEDIILYLP